ncbi:hypothetical protein AVEN_33622-2 [Araneus ventricosus]|uniref:Uncharacterized protein n=1 Tax=Araneus ventricosus TaxID=182803 RepID=A0A4Y2N571_ARAVE|nr:hypothetical protein AVEN_33622-2 [Araneus ventricosus]
MIFIVEKASPFQDFVIPALDQETYGVFLQFGPGLGVFTLERFSCTEEDFWKASPFQVSVIPALEQERYGEFLSWGPGLGVFTLERFSYTEEESRVSISQNINYDRSVGPRRTTKVSQEVWASNLGMKQEESTHSPAEKQMEPTTSKYQEKPNFPKTKISANSGKTPKGSIPTVEASVKTKKKSKGGQKKKKSTSEISYSG